MTERPEDHGSRGAMRILAPARIDATGTLRGYVRFAALGDSVTFGVGDPGPQGPRGWAGILASAIARDHDVSFLNTARTGATAGDVRSGQLRAAVDHRPHVASLIVGLNDSMRSSWDPARLRADLMECGSRLTERGLVLLTVRFHDHARVFGLPRAFARPMTTRIRILNDIYDELHHEFGGIQVDLGEHPGIYDREFWSIDRLHPSELGHRALAHEFAQRLGQHGLSFEAPDLELDGVAPTRLDELRHLAVEGVPWAYRRVKDLSPAACRRVFARALGSVRVREV